MKTRNINRGGSPFKLLFLALLSLSLTTQTYADTQTTKVINDNNLLASIDEKVNSIYNKLNTSSDNQEEQQPAGFIINKILRGTCTDLNVDTLAGDCNKEASQSINNTLVIRLNQKVDPRKCEVVLDGCTSSSTEYTAIEMYHDGGYHSYSNSATVPRRYATISQPRLLKLENITINGVEVTQLEVDNAQGNWSWQVIEYN